MRVAVAMSGGVDSSVAAALLAERGEEVVGFTLKVWEESRCCSLEDVDDARRVARHLGIPFFVLDAHDAFEAEVVEPFVEAYRRGRTPNPCIRCNQRVKFRWLLERAQALGCEALATGHYARLDGPPRARRLRKGLDPTKDQSYFLVPERPGDLDRVRFPLGGLTKEAVRRMARERGLPVAAKSDSQDVCFVPGGDLAGFLEGRLGPSPPGEVVDRDGVVLGRHRGVHAYTVGQRKGLGISAPVPLYVAHKDAGTNRLTVAPREALLARGLTGEGAVWMAGAPPEGPFACAVKIRSTAHEVPCTVTARGTAVRVRFRTPQFGVAPGQMAVFYKDDTVLGGAWIEEALRSENE
ncbi:MAG: tRNA 2-thiouridine(34) synthase MnmA [Deferrisomatales bacterium]